MPDSTIGIKISAESEGAVEAINNVINSTEGLGEAMDKLGPRFAHFGAHEASISLVEMAGVTGHVRPLVMALTGTMTTLAESIGLTTAAIGPFFAAFSAISGIYLMNKAASDKEKEGLEEQYARYQENTKAADEYTAAGGRLSEAMRAEAEQNRALAAETLNTMKTKMEAKLQDDELALASHRLTDALSQTGIATNAGADFIQASEATKKLTQAVIDDNAALDAYAHGAATAAEYQKQLTEEQQKSTEAAKAGAEAIQAWLDKAIEKETKELDAQNKLNEAASAAAADERNRSLEWRIMMDQRAQAADAAAQKAEADSDKIGASFLRMEATAKGAINRINNEFSGGFAKMLAEHKSFGEAFDGVWARMEESAIQALTNMILKVIELYVWQEALLAIEAMTGTTGGGGAANFSGGNPFGGGGLNLGGVQTQSLSWGGHFAEGGTFKVNEPTMIQVGEAGEETVSIVPSGGGGSLTPMSPGGGVNIGSINVGVNVGGVSDPRELADQIGLEIIQAIRGRGQIAFAGPGIG